VAIIMRVFAFASPRVVSLRCVHKWCGRVDTSQSTLSLLLECC
jgi:hypothetical protein